MSETALTPIEQRSVLFYDDELTGLLIQFEEKQEIYVPVRPICTYLGLNWSGQYQRLQRDSVLSESIRGVCVTQTPEKGGTQEMLCLPLKYLPGWLFGISANRVKPELKERILRYQRECYDVLWEAFQEGRLVTDSSFDDLLQTESEAVQAYKMLQAMVKLARNQVLIEAKLNAQANQLALQDGRLEQHDAVIEENKQRIEELESTLGYPEHQITPSQAMQISQGVKAVALELSKQTKRNEYGGVYGELYRRFEITSYKLLPANKFEEAMDWLREWYGALVGKAPF